MDPYSSIDRFVIGGREIAWQVFARKGKLADTLLITAGMDGDELTGIAIARALMALWNRVIPPLSVIIIPEVNRIGNDCDISWNPQDGLFPKRCTPNGRNYPSVILMRRLFNQYASKASVWIDLHSGAASEVLNPFLWIHGPGETHEVDIPFQGSDDLTIPVVVTDSDWPIADYAKQYYGIRYMVVEAGYGNTVQHEHVIMGRELVQSIALGVAHDAEGRVGVLPDAPQEVPDGDLITFSKFRIRPDQGVVRQHPAGDVAVRLILNFQRPGLELVRSPCDLDDLLEGPERRRCRDLLGRPEQTNLLGIYAELPELVGLTLPLGLAVDPAAIGE
jgi:hypothetical protein